MTATPATEKEILTALNARINQLEKKFTGQKPAAPDVSDLEARMTALEEQLAALAASIPATPAVNATALEARVNNAINELEARAERAIASVALLTRQAP